jgi:transposase-like protein
VERVFGDRVEVQRCQIHKRRNVKEYLPENCQRDYDRRMRNAYAMNSYIGQRSFTENLSIAGTDQSECCPQLGGRPGRNADRTSPRNHRGLAPETGHD